LRQREFAITFRRDVHQNLPLARRREVHFLNHLSPLIRWITAQNQDSQGGFYNLSAVQLDDSAWQQGVWVYRIERWMLRGLRTQEQLAYAAVRLEDGRSLSSTDAEQLVQSALSAGKDWDYVDCTGEAVRAGHQQVEKDLKRRLDETIEQFRAENENSFHIRMERTKNLFDRRIAQDQQRLESLRQNQRSAQAIRLTEARLKKAEDSKARKLADLQAKAYVDLDKSEVAAGVIRVG
jgi:hypothetical protein